MKTSATTFFGMGSLGGSPILVAMIASSLCAVGLLFFVEGTKTNSVVSKTRIPASKKVPSRLSHNHESLVYTGISAVVVSMVVLAWTKSIIMTTPFSIFAVVTTWIHFRQRARRENVAMLQVWPEVTDHLISAIHSGLSLTEALVGLGVRGPEIIRPYFLSFHNELLETGNFISSAERLKARLDTHGSDQILEAIIMAKSLGGSELLQIFRTLGDFLRQDLTLRKEIEIKHGWIKNSAHLSSAAPWLLLLLLSSQPGTAQAFAQPGGMAILLLGLLLTAAAYMWMGKLGQLPATPRVFE